MTDLSMLDIGITPGLDRKWIEEKYLPSLSGSVLYVGVAHYTAHYESLAKNASTFSTLDANKSEAQYGSKTCHYNIDFMDLDVQNTFDHVSLYGIFGSKNYNNNSLDQIHKIHEKAANHVNPGGTLMLGPGWRQNIWGPNTQEVILDMFRKDFLRSFTPITLIRAGSNIIYWAKK